MSGIASLFNIPGTPEEANSWAFAHASHHRDIIKAIFEQYRTSLPEYVLEPLPLRDMSTWVYQHQQMHNDMNQITGISGYNLSNVDWQNIESRSGWIFSNAAEHTRIAGVLRIGPNAIPPPNVQITFLSSAQQQPPPATPVQTFTFPGMSIGAASGARYIIACVSTTGANPTSGLAGVTINGTAAIRLAVASSGINSVGIFILYVPSGTTATIAVSNNTAAPSSTASVALYSITGISSPAASQTATDINTTAPSGSLTVNTNGAVIAVAENGGGLVVAPTATWSGVPKQAQATFVIGLSGAIATSGSRNVTSFGTINITCTFTGMIARGAGCFAAFNP